MFLKTFSMSTLLLLSTSAFCFPRGCEVTGFGYNGTNLVVNELEQQAFYLIQNHSPKPIKMERVTTKEGFMSPPLTATIDPNQWAAFASDVANMHFQCFSIDKANPVKIDCREVLEVCQYPRAKFALSNMGNYWVSVNKEQRQVINDSAAKGIYLRW